MTSKILAFFLFSVILVGCGDDELLIPRPLANLRVNFPERSYHPTDANCPYQFDLASYMTSKPATNENLCHIDVDLGQFNGMLHISYVEVNNNLPELVAYSIDKVREHQVKASAIQDSVFIFPEHQVYGTMYEFYGNAATPFQFHFTDSVNHFIRGTMYFNATPNFDSIYPVLQYVKQDLIHLFESNTWE
jgi:gliding motility-associated lipoprotein GldD